MRREVERTDVTANPGPTIECRGCGRKIRPFYNGGELDREECCGYEYETEAVRIELVVRAPIDATVVER